LSDRYVDRAGLAVALELAEFLEQRALPGTGLHVAKFWAELACVFSRFAPENARLLKRRTLLQAEIDAWHKARSADPHDQERYVNFLREIGYLEPDPAPLLIETAQIDAELSRRAGPQLVAPAMNARFVLNAANARWGSLYDALYGSDVVPGTAKSAAYDPERGAQVIAWAKAFLDEATPLRSGSWADFSGEAPDLRNPAQLVGKRDGGLLFRNNGLHIELVIDPGHPIGARDPARIANVILESALSTIVDFEDSIAAVDAQDKVLAYSNWLGLLRGDLTDTFLKNGQAVTRRLAEDRVWTSVAGQRFTLPGRSLMLVRNVGHLMTTPALLMPDGSEAPEGILDAVVTALAGMHDLKRLGRFINSHAGSIYIVKPKQHGPAECAFTERVFSAVEDMLGLSRHTLKVGLMDEERRTSANLAACIHSLRQRLFFINTGFLDRTGDEIHTSMHAGPMIAKNDMKASAWIGAYEARNVAVGLSCGLSGRAQIGKGMWAVPDMMADMLEKKIYQLRAGASTAWTPSPTAATLHAIHYHKVDVFARHLELAREPTPPIEQMLTIPLAEKHQCWTREEVQAELDNNVQGILGYVVRWIDQGIGCSKVPDIRDIGLMEDRATLRISAQHIANWLRHGIVTPAEVNTALTRMAAKVDSQNAGDTSYEPLRPNSLALQAARRLIFCAIDQPNGYTEPLLHTFRLKRKSRLTDSGFDSEYHGYS
jgi:malate synthase